MNGPLDPESLDLAEVAAMLSSACGPVVQGAIVGRTLLRDAVVRHLGCSQLEGEMVIDTMIGRGFVVRSEVGGVGGWSIKPIEA